MRATAAARVSPGASTVAGVPARKLRQRTWRPAIAETGRASSQLPGPPSRSWVAAADARSAAADSRTAPAGPRGAGGDHDEVGAGLERFLRPQHRAGRGHDRGRPGGEDGERPDAVQRGGDVVPGQVGRGHEGEVPGHDRQGYGPAELRCRT